MTRLTDGRKTVGIVMMTRKYGQCSPDWSNDFYAVGALPYNDGLDAFVVPDVDGCIEQANDWKNGIGDFYNPDDDTDPENKLVFVWPKVINERGTEIDYESAVMLMDDELREALHLDLAPCSEQAFFDAYCKAHMEKYGEAFECAKENPCW